MKPPVVVNNLQEVHALKYDDTEESPVAIVFHPGVEFPLKPNARYSDSPENSDCTITVTKDLTISETGFPIGRRKTYHPPRYYDINSFSTDTKELFKKKLRTGTSYTKKGGILIFVIDPQIELSIFNACSILGHYYHECHNRRTNSSHEYHDVTLVPFPFNLTSNREKGIYLRHGDTQRQLCWVSYWYPPIDDVDMSISETIIRGNKKFPAYHDEYFPVIALDYIEDEAIAFAVNANKGAIIVIPSSVDLSVFLADIERLHNESGLEGFELCSALKKYNINRLSGNIDSPTRSGDSLKIEVVELPTRTISLYGRKKSIKIRINSSDEYIELVPFRAFFARA